MSWIREVIDWLAPVVCDACEGGSGLLLDPSAGLARACPSCRGTGRWVDEPPVRGVEPLPLPRRVSSRDRSAA